MKTRPWLPQDVDADVVGRAITDTINYALREMYGMKDGDPVSDEQWREAAWASFVMLTSVGISDPNKAKDLHPLGNVN
jgi:hypothetical protein